MKFSVECGVSIGAKGSVITGVKFDTEIVIDKLNVELLDGRLSITDNKFIEDLYQKAKGSFLKSLGEGVAKTLKRDDITIREFSFIMLGVDSSNSDKVIKLKTEIVELKSKIKATKEIETKNNTGEGGENK